MNRHRLGPVVRAEHPDWDAPEWIDFAIRYFAANLSRRSRIRGRNGKGTDRAAFPERHLPPGRDDPFAVDHSGPAAELSSMPARASLPGARRADWVIVHVHIAFAPDYSDLPRNCRLFRAVESSVR